MRNMAVIAALLALLAVSCTTIDEWEENPVRAKAKAELAGSAVVMTFFVANPDNMQHAPKMREAVTTLKAALEAETGVPAAGFVGLMPAITEKLKEKLTGDNVVYLPPAILLAQLLLIELDSRADSQAWSTRGAVVKDVTKAFLAGADSALDMYATASP
jgi:hypothetical protein